MVVEHKGFSAAKDMEASRALGPTTTVATEGASENPTTIEISPLMAHSKQRLKKEGEMTA